jgi:hypothetical protein
MGWGNMGDLQLNVLIVEWILLIVVIVFLPFLPGFYLLKLQPRSSCLEATIINNNEKNNRTAAGMTGNL